MMDEQGNELVGGDYRFQTRFYLELTCFRPRIPIKSTPFHATNGDYRDQTKHRFRAWPLG